MAALCCPSPWSVMAELKLGQNIHRKRVPARREREREREGQSAARTDRFSICARGASEVLGGGHLPIMANTSEW